METLSGRQRLLQACARLLIPIVRYLLKGGVSWKEFSDISKTVFVQVATDDFGIRGRPTNASRVAILTGLDRREVRKQREALKHQDASGPGYMTKASQVLDGWHHDLAFLDAKALPRPLSMDRDGETLGFGDLVRKYAPALPAVAMLKELKAANAVEELANGLLRPLTRSYIPRHMPQEQVRLWSSTISDLASAVGYNFTRAAGAPALFQRRAINLTINPHSLPEFKMLLEKEGQALLVKIDDWLSAHQQTGVESDHQGIRLGVGIYEIQDNPSDRQKK